MNDNDRFKELLDCGFPTGSAYWGCSDPKDIDYVVKVTDWERIIGTELGKFYYGFKKEDYNCETFRSFYYDYNGNVYNFIIPHEIEMFRAYRLATKWMKNIPVQYISMKSSRVQLFECFLTIINQKNYKPVTPNIMSNFAEHVPF